MASHSAPASRTLLLNYWAYFLPTTTIYKALKTNDFLVALSVIGSLAFKIITVVSTGLLTLDNLLVEQHNVPLIASTTFVGDDGRLGDIGDLPFYVYQGVQLANLPYPEGTNQQFAFQSFHSAKNQNGSISRADLDAFSGNLECERAQMNFGNWEVKVYASENATNVSTSGPDLQPNITISIPSCSINFTTPNLGPYCDRPKILSTNTTQTAIGPIGIYSLCRCANSQESRFAILVGAAMQGGSTVDANPTVTYNLVNSTQLICSSTYAINRALITTNWTQGTARVELLPEAGNRTLTNVTGLDLANAFGETIARAVARVPLDSLNPFLGHLHNAVSQAGNPSLTNLMSTDTLGNLSNSYFRTLTAQIARTALLKGDSIPITGTSWDFESRLVLRLLSVRIIEAVLIVLLLFSGAMIFLIPNNGIMPLDPDSIGGLAILISKSAELKRSLTGMGLSPLSSISDRISSNRYQTTVTFEGAQRTFEIQQPEHILQVSPNKQEAESLCPQNDTVTWWRPFGATIYARLLALASVIATVIALELVLRDSQRHVGFAGVDPKGYGHYASAYIPALIMVSIGLLFSDLDDTTKVFAPYSKLKYGGASWSDLFINYSRFTKVEALWLSIKSRNLAVIATSSASFLGSFLTIVVSGVYAVNNVPSSQAVELSMKTWFNASDNLNLQADPSAITLASLVAVANLSYPAWTYDELAFATLELTTSNMATENRATISAKIPAVRPRLDCTLLVGDNSSIGSTLTWCLPPTEFCSGANLFVNFTPPPTPLGGYSCGTRTSSVGTVFSNSIFGYDDQFLENCHTWVWGSIGASSIENIAALSCHEDVEQIMVNTTLLFPSLAIDSTQPPIPDESTAQHSATFISMPPTYTFWLANITGTWSNETSFDQFFNILAASNEAPPLHFFSNPGLATNVSHVIQHLHKILLAQIYGYTGPSPFTGLSPYSYFSMRINSTEGAEQTTFTGTAVDPNSERLVQRVPSTRTLQALLAAMGLCVLIQSAFLRTKDVLPKDPRSIAGLASLLVDSEMLELVQHECDRRGGPARHALEGRLFGIGWFEGEKMDNMAVMEGLVAKELGVRKRRFTIDVIS